MDSGFFDQKIYRLGEKPKIGDICGGKLYKDIKKEIGAENYLAADGIVSCYHERGSDDLANRALKDFSHEQLPFKKSNPNAAWYYSMLLYSIRYLPLNAST